MRRSRRSITVAMLLWVTGCSGGGDGVSPSAGGHGGKRGVDAGTGGHASGSGGASSGGHASGSGGASSGGHASGSGGASSGGHGASATGGGIATTGGARSDAGSADPATPDAGSDPDAAIDAAGAGGALGSGGTGGAVSGTPDRIYCEYSPCSVSPPSVCCWGATKKACLAHYCDYGQPLACDDAADCPEGEICCGSPTTGSACAASCNGSQLCRTDEECVSGTCKPTDVDTQYASCQ